MSLPKKISPNPLVTSTVELRFVSGLGDGQLLSRIYPTFSQEFPKLINGQIPTQIKKLQPQFQFAPDHIMSNDEYSISFGNSAISFENIISYPLWDNYFAFIKKQLIKLFELKLFVRIDRVGIRYASILSGVTIPSQALKYIPAISIDGYNNEEFELFRTNLKKSNYNFHLQVARNAIVTKQGISKSGLYIDIDASVTMPLQPDLSAILIYLENLHMEQKAMFFEIIRPEYLNTLNPEY